MGRPSAKETGFTLVEILAVLFIMALATSVVILSVEPPKSVLDKQAARLTGELNALAQDGVLSGSVNAAGFSEDGYTLYSFENSEWTERVSGEWQDSYRLTLERASVKLDMPKKTGPIIMFQPTGLSTPFTLKLSDSEVTYALKAAGDGRVELVKSSP